MQRYLRTKPTHKKQLPDLLFQLTLVVSLGIGVLYFLTYPIIELWGLQKIVERILLCLGVLLIMECLYKASINLNDHPYKPFKIRNKGWINRTRAGFILKQFRNRKGAALVESGLAIETANNYGFKIPEVNVEIQGVDGTIYIENLGQRALTESDSLRLRLNGLLKGYSSHFTIVQTDMLMGDKWARALVENVNVSHRFHYKGDVRDFISDNIHEIKLADNLSWRANLDPHLSIIGRSGAGKGVCGGFVADLAAAQGWNVVYHSLKTDGAVGRFNGKSDVDGIIADLESRVDEMYRRQKYITQRFPNKDGVDYTDAGLRDVLVVLDEMGWMHNALNSKSMAKQRQRYENALSVLAKGARSTGIHLLMMAQVASTESFPSSVRSQAQDAVIMLGNTNGQERQYMFPGTVTDRRFGKGEGIARFVSSGDRWQEVHYFEAPWLEK